MKPWKPRKIETRLENGVYQPTISEENVITELIVRFSWEKIRVYRIRERIPGMSRILSTPGIPDLIGWIPQCRIEHLDGNTIKTCTRAVPLFIEVKRPKGVGHQGGVHRIAQTRFIEEAKGDGCIAFFADCWADCVAEFKKYGIELLTH